MTGEIAAPADILAFWRAAGQEKWFTRDDAFDRTIAERFAATHETAAAGRFSHWAETPEGALALIILLDQFSRQLYRGRPEAFAQDPMALKLAHRSIEAGYDRQCDPAMRSFFYLPYMHSEAIADQERCVLLWYGSFGPDGLKYALEHRDIIRRFGRFPHRNAILGRHTTPAEQSFLDGGGFAG